MQLRKRISMRIRAKFPGETKETIMNTDNSQILSLVLDAAAPNPEYWSKGYDAYHSSTDAELERYYAALDAAAPDKERWRNGYDVLLDHGIAEARKEIPTHNDVPVYGDASTYEDTNVSTILLEFDDTPPAYHWSHSPLALIPFIALGAVVTLVIWVLLGLVTNLTGFLSFLLFVSIAMLCISSSVLLLQNIRMRHDYYPGENVSTVTIDS